MTLQVARPSHLRAEGRDDFNNATIKIKKLSETDMSTENEQGKAIDFKRQEVSGPRAPVYVSRVTRET